MHIIDAHRHEIDVQSLCRAFGVAPATYYRSKEAPKERSPRRSHRRLGECERAQVMAVLTGEEFIDKTVPEVYHTLLDRDEYLCSVSTMYGILRENRAVRERRDQRRHPEYVKPVLVASAPNQVWSWDITKLKGPRRREYYYLYSILDIFSRYTVGWRVATSENGDLARDLIETTCQRQGIMKHQLSIHSDRGAPMKSKTVLEMMEDRGILKSFSRPRVSDDNPYSESQFKTLKYHPTFPESFGSIQDARAFLRTFFDWYNFEHYHSGIAMLTPGSVHFGTTGPIIEARQKTLGMAFERHPERFVKGLPSPQYVPAEAWINQPCQQVLEAA